MHCNNFRDVKTDSLFLTQTPKTAEECETFVKCHLILLECTRVESGVLVHPPPSSRQHRHRWDIVIAKTGGGVRM